MKRVIYGLCVVLCVQGMVSAQEIKVCGANINITQYDPTLSATIIYKSLECVKKEDSLEAERAFRKPQEYLQPRLSVLFTQLTQASGLYTLVVLKDGEVVVREESDKPSFSTAHSRFLGGVSCRPVQPPFEFVLMTTSGSEHRLRAKVSTTK